MQMIVFPTTFMLKKMVKSLSLIVRTPQYNSDRFPCYYYQLASYQVEINSQPKCELGIPNHQKFFWWKFTIFLKVNKNVIFDSCFHAKFYEEFKKKKAFACVCIYLLNGDGESKHNCCHGEH